MANDIKFENSVYLTGYVGRDPEHRVFSSGTKLATFSIAVTPPARPGRQQKSMWFDVEAWDDDACKVQDLSFGKGALVTVYGALVPNVYKQTVNGVEVEMQKVKVRLAELDVKPKKGSVVKKSEEESVFEQAFGFATQELLTQSLVAERAITDTDTDTQPEPAPAQELITAAKRIRGRKTA